MRHPPEQEPETEKDWYRAKEPAASDEKAPELEMAANWPGKGSKQEQK